MPEDGQSKGISLRKKKSKKPQISAPKQISGPLPTGLANNSSTSVQTQRTGVGTSPAPNNRIRNESPAPSVGSGRDVRPRPRRDNTTEDLVKRRYSTRFNQLPNFDPNGAPPMPGMPAIPAQFQQKPPPSRGRDTEGRQIKVDPKILRDPNLRPEQYISSVLADASDSDITHYQEQLRNLKQQTETDLQHNVYQNRTQFIKISKEAEKLKAEMRTLRTLMSDLTETLGQTTSNGSLQLSGDKQTARNRANRSSVANLEALWNSHLQTLWKRVEGSQKFLPAIPGRHIVYESGRWVELNAATWKARRKVHLILLNDHLLIAAEKKRPDAATQNAREAKGKQDKTPQQLVAQRCWPLQDVQIADLASKAGPGGKGGEGKQANANAVNVRVGNESFTFALPTAYAQEKNTLLSAFRKAQEDLRKIQEAETEERGKAQDSVNYFATRDLNILKKTDLLETLSENTTSQKSSMFVEIDGKQQSIRSVESKLDELDIDIALQHFEKAVAHLEELKKTAKGIRGNVVAQDLITFKVNERAAKLASMIIRQLVETHAWASATRKHVEWLTRLGFEDSAREAYLDARTSNIKKRARQCIFDGDLRHYIYQSGFIFFTAIRNTVRTYQNCFPASMMSACVKWAKEHVDQFNVVLSRQLSSVDENSDVYKDCMGSAKEHAGLLDEVGLDFKEMVGRDSGIGFLNGDGAAVGLGVS